ncbi:DASS family sodium-coupled anion symporter [Parvularcula marina]|uniref:SLC13 family permease n=1 Tax=Parvularcula marina TaxID=2292771 RepID=UPI0035129893
MTTKSIEAPALHQRVGLILGPVAALLVFFFFDAEGVSDAGVMTAAVATLMAIWWATEAAPVAVTAFLPLVLFPALGVSPISETAPSYAHPIIYLFLGGFVIALGIERTGLHRRVALSIFRLAGVNGRSLVGGFMAAAAIISMWISNTSTTLMLLPIAMSVIVVIRESMTSLTEKERRDFETSLLLGLAYGATLGGVATLVGTPPNAFMAGFMETTYNEEIDFRRWMIVGVPVSAIMLPLTWLLLTRIVFKVGFKSNAEARQHIAELGSGLGPMSKGEVRIAMLFVFLVGGWLFRKPIANATGLAELSDAGIAMAAAIGAFLIPSGERREALVTWEDTKRLPWGVLILFGGGLALAGAMTSSGLTEWLGRELAPLGTVNIVILVVASAALVIFLTELTSNLATTATFLPVMAAIAVETGQDPLVFVIPVTLAASCAFMLPVATPPNAIVFSSGSVSIPRMMRAGVMLNLIGVVVLSLVAIFLAPVVFG